VGGFLPPVVFAITANATQAMATFKGVNTQLKIMDAQAKKTGVAMAAMTKSIALATAAAKAFALVGAAFAAYGVKEIMSLEQAYARLGQTMSAVGVSTEANRTKLADAAQSMEALGFDAATASDALSILLQTTRDVETSQRLLATAADLARARTMDLATAARLLSRAQAGNTRIFNMFGIQLDKNKDKATATREAMDKLTQVIGGQAEAYTKTLAGQLAVLGKQIENVAEGIGAVLLPYLQKFIEIIQKLGKYLADHKEILVALGFVIGTVLVTAVANLTKRLVVMAAAWAAANWPILAVVAALAAAGAAFVWAWNKFKGFRDGVINYGKILIIYWGNLAKGVLLFAETAVMAFQLALNGFLLLVRAAANAQIALGKLKNDDEMVKRGQATLRWIDSVNKNIENFGNKIVGAREKLDKFVNDAVSKLENLKNAKIDLSGLKLPSLKIGDFGNQNGTFDDPTGLAADIKKSLDKAEQHIKDFNTEAAAQFKQLGETWKRIVTKDFEKAIYERIGDPIDDVIYQAQNAIDRYSAASSMWGDANVKLGKAQNAYIEALKTGKDELILGAESALSAAEGAISDLYQSMAEALEDLEKLQEDMINAVAALYEQISELEAQRTKILKEAQKERLELEKDYNKNVASIRKDYDRNVLRAEDEAAKRRVEIIKTSIDQLRGIFRSATTKSLGDIFSGLTYEGRYLKGGTTEKIIAALGLQKGKAENLAADAAALAGLGFSQTFIEEVVSQGPDMGHKLAQTIIKSSPESIAQMKSYWEALQTVSNHGVDNVAKNLNTGIVLATEELTAQLAQISVDLATELKSYEQDLVESLAEAFEAYSESLDAINNRTAEQISEIDKQIAQLQAKIAMLKNALAGITGLQPPGAIGGGPNIIPRAETTEEEGIATSCESGKGIYKVVKFQGTEMSRTLVRCVPKTGSTTDTDADAAAANAVAAAAALAEAERLAAEALAAFEASERERIAALYAANVDSAAGGNRSNWKDYTGGDFFSGTGNDESTRLRGMRASGATINITAKTNASAQEIANEVGWAIRTSGDVQYRTNRTSGTVAG
jgi:hypothetical protein